MTYVLDTNIVTYWLQGREHIRQKRDVALENNHSIIIPPMVFYEVWRGLLKVNAVVKQAAFLSVFADAPSISLPADMWEIAARIHSDLTSSGIVIGDLDILIAAFCIIQNYTLVTNNTRHFERINELAIIDWME